MSGYKHLFGLVDSNILRDKEERENDLTEGMSNSMAANGKAKTTKSTEAQTQNGPVAYVRQTAERAVDVPVGAALIARDRVNDVVEPWTSSETRSKELKGIRTQVTRELNKFERRGGQARRKASTRVRRTRNRIERQVIQRRRAVEKGVKQNRGKLEQRLRTVTSRV
jgi:hypothetical protein